MAIPHKTDLTRELTVAAALVIGGALIAGYSTFEIVGHRTVLAQATQPLQSTPGAETKPPAPSPTTSGTTGVRPQEVAPQPARPDADAQQTGARPALPPAPAEKTADPIPTR